VGRGILCLGLVLVGCLPAAAETPAPLTVTLLGTGNPRPSAERFGPSALIEAGGHRVLVDAGRGATIRLAEIGLSSGSVEAVLLTHLHSDHVVGLPDLWLTGWIFGRTGPLRVVGPPGTQALAQGLEAAFAFDVHMRRDVDERFAGEGVRLEVREVEDGEAYRTPDGLVVTSFTVDHGLVRPALGYRADYLGHAVVFSGDTKPSENLVAHARGADVLIHEVVADEVERRDTQTPLVTDRIVAHHTTVLEAATLFARVRPRLAVYSHIVPSTVREADLIPATRTRYDGPLEVGYDLMQIVVGTEVRVVDRRPPGARPAR
jgi:ribonuclease Z